MYSHNCVLEPHIKKQKKIQTKNRPLPPKKKKNEKKSLHLVHNLFIISAEVHAQQMMCKRLGSGKVNPYAARQDVKMAGIW